MTEAPVPSPPILTYAMKPEPDPIQVSTPANLIFVVSTTSTCTVSQIEIKLPVGDAKDATNLTDGRPDEVSISASDHAPWKRTDGVADGLFLFTPPGGSVLFSEQSLRIEVTGIQVSPLIGNVQIAISEWAAPGSSPAPSPDDKPPSGQKVITTAKFPEGFSVGEFHPDKPQVDYGDTALLTWVGTGNADYSITYDGQSANATGYSWRTPALYAPEYQFMLTASFSEGGQTVEHYETTGVIVASPKVLEFSATPNQIDYHDPVTLNWRAVHADGIYLWTNPDHAKQDLRVIRDPNDHTTLIPDPANPSTLYPVYGKDYALQAYQNKGPKQLGSEPFSLEYEFNKLAMTFTGQPLTVTDGQSTKLSWTVQHAKPDSVKYQGQGVPASGSHDEHPASDTTYTLEATWVDDRTVQATPVQVKVVSVPGDGYPSWMTGDFTGSGQSQLLFRSSGQRWGLGAFTGTKLGWTAIDAAPPEVDTKSALTWVADFTGDDQAQIMSYSSGDRTWRVGTLTGTSLGWTPIGWQAPEDAFSHKDRTWVGGFFGMEMPQVVSYSPGNQQWWRGWFWDGASSGFLRDVPYPGTRYAPGDPTWAGYFGARDYLGTRYWQILFCSRADQSWWLATLWQVGVIEWAKAADAASQFHHDPGDPTWVADFTGAGQSQVLLCVTLDSIFNQDWWLGTFTGSSLSWARACPNTGFGYDPGNHPTWVGDFSGVGKSEILFCWPADQNWWLGTFTGTSLSWHPAGNTASQFHYDPGDSTWIGDFTGVHKSQILRYSPARQSWWLGTFTGTSLSWIPVV